MVNAKGGDSHLRTEGLRMVQVESTAYFAVQYPEGGLNRDTGCLVVLHGWGQNSRSFLRKFERLRQHNIVVVAPQAPHQFYLDQITRKVGFGWLTSFDRDRGVAMAVAALDRVLTEVAAEFERPLCPVVLGFSQGAPMAWRYAVRGIHPVCGVVACGGDLPADVETALAGRTTLEVLLVHGQEDGIVPRAKGEEAAATLHSLGLHPQTLFFAGGHDIPETLVDRLPAWMGACAPRSRTQNE